MRASFFVLRLRRGYPTPGVFWRKSSESVENKESAAQKVVKSVAHLRGLTQDPVLIGTWADAVWAIRFYEKHGFRMVRLEEKDRLLEKYWKISQRQRETSVVLTDSKWRGIGV
jgi:hypothetical protein